MAHRPKGSDAGEDQVRVGHIHRGRLTFDTLEAGEPGAPLVLLLHGFPQTAEAWRPLLPALAEAGYHAMALTQRGYSPGARPRRVADYVLPHLVDDALAVASEAGADRFHLVGHDWGGVVAWAVAARCAHRVRTVTVVSTPHPRALMEVMPRSLQPLRSAYVGFFALPVLPERLMAAGGGRVLRRTLTLSGLPAPTAGRYAEVLGRPDALGAALRWYRAAVTRPWALGAVGPVEVPATLVWGPADAALGPAAARATGRHVTGPYRLVVLDGAGHWIPETRAGELAAAVLERIVDR